MSVIVNNAPISTLSSSEVDRWRKVPVSVIVDLDESIRQIDPSIALLQSAGHVQPVLFGRAVTAACEPPDFGAVLYAIDHVDKGDVLVIAANGVASHAMIGEILGGHLRSKGVAGVVCHGAIRDTANLSNWQDFPVYTSAINARGPVGAECGAVNQSVTLVGCQLNPGDWVIGDADGVVVLSEAEMQTWIDAAEARLETEANWERRLADGESVAAVFGL